MEMAAHLMNAVLVEGQPVRKVAREHGVFTTRVYEQLARYRAHGEAGLVPRSKRPHHSPTKIAERFEDEIVRIRKTDRAGLRRPGRDHIPRAIHS
jgi:transposase